MNKKFKIYFICLSIFCFAVALIRSINMGITCDEATTYLNYINKNWFLNLDLIANNHLLNTILVQVIVTITRMEYNPFILRVPNLIIYLIYLYYSYKISKLYNNKYSLVTALLLNYSVNEFASLARGYGMASAFILAALYYYKLYVTYKDVRNFGLSILFLILACSSNTMCLIAAFIFVIDFLIRGIRNKNLKKNFMNNIGFISITFFIFLLLFVYHIFIYMIDDYLSLGFSYCTKDLFSCLIYSPFKYYGVAFISKYIVGALFFILVILLVLSLKKNYKENNLFYMSFVVWTILIILKYILKFNFPTGRVMIPFFSIYIISLFDSIDLIFGEKSKYLMIIIMIFPFISFFKNLNIYYVREWEGDYHLKKQVEKIVKQKQKIDPNTVPEALQPTLDYYYRKYKKLNSYDILSDTIYDD